MEYLHKADLLEIVQEIEEIGDNLSESCERLRDVASKLSGTRAENILRGYVISYLDSILGNEPNITLCLPDVLNELEEFPTIEGGTLYD